jgi:hypothetical protein
LGHVHTLKKNTPVSLCCYFLAFVAIMTKRIHEDFDALVDSMCRHPDVDLGEVLLRAGLDTTPRGSHDYTSAISAAAMES